LGLRRSDEAAGQVGRHQPEGAAAAGAAARTTASGVGIEAARTAWAMAAEQPAASVRARPAANQHQAPRHAGTCARACVPRIAQRAGGWLVT